MDCRKLPPDFAYRTSHVKNFFRKLNFDYSNVLSKFLDDLGAEIVEDLKNAEDDDWDAIKKILNLKLLQKRKLDKAISALKAIDFDPHLFAPLPLNDDNQSCKFNNKLPQENRSQKLNGGNLLTMKNFLIRSKEHHSSDDDSIDTSDDNILNICDDDSIKDNALLVCESKPDWRELRTTVGSMEGFNKLDDLAPDYEQCLWNLEVVKHHQCLQDPETKNYKNNNIQDYLGYYKVLGNGFSRETPLESLVAGYKEKKKWFRSESRKSHPDQNPDDEKAKKRWEMLASTNNHVEKAYSILCTTSETIECNDAMLFSPRWNYDHQCDVLRASWQYATKYSDECAKEEFDKKNVGNKISNSKKKKKSPMERCVYLYETIGQQNNFWRIAVHECITKADSSMAKIAREIRKCKGSPGWDGVAKHDKEYRRIYKKVLDGFETVKKGNIKVDTIVALPKKEKMKVLKRKRSSMLESRRMRQKKESPKVRMEKAVFQYILDLRKKSKKVSRTIIFRKVIDEHPLFYGGPNAIGFMRKLCNWFYYSFTHRYVTL